MNESSKINQFNYFLKGDISGIQEFIFNVKSERAARILKGRSFYIQALSEVCLSVIREHLGENNVQLLYNGGGNFYLFAKEVTISELEDVKAIIMSDSRMEAFYLTLSKTSLRPNDDGNFGEVWSNLHSESNKEKLQKYANYYPVFETYPYNPDREKWLEFTRTFINSNGFEIKDSAGNKGVFTKHLTIFKKDFILTKDIHQFDANIINELPRWTEPLLIQYHQLILEENTKNEERLVQEREEKYTPPKKENIIEFTYLAKFAKERTGSDKLGVLKMDIDNLGQLFSQNRNLEATKTISRELKWFFEEKISLLLNDEFEYTDSIFENDTVSFFQAKSTFRDNIYVVFSGGDDCFLLGAWDAVFEFGLKVRVAFLSFIEDLRKKVTSLPEKVTLSAGLIVVGPKFPVIRFAHLAEEALEEAKTGTKNKINVFGQTLKWEDFIEAKQYAATLTKLVVQQGESRGILERIKRSAKGFTTLQNRAAKRDPSSTWRLFYYLRTVKKENRPEIEPIIKAYTNAILATFVNKKASLNPQLFPVAARWAEFLSKKQHPIKVNLMPLDSEV